MNLAATMTLNTAGFLGPLAAARGAMGSLIAPLAALTGGALSLAGAMSLLKSSIGEAAGMEDFETGFRSLLGSADAAKGRMAELAKVAADTPFELPELVSASRLLQAFTGDALATGEGLRMVGDAAAAVNQPLEAVTMWMGRLYAGLKDGQPLGEPIQNLTQLGLISGETRKQLLAMQGQTLSSAQVMEVLNAAFGKNAGAMAALSQTYNGKLSNMADAWGAVRRALGEPVRDALKPYLDGAISLFEKMVPLAESIGQRIAAALEMFRAAWADGTLGNVVGDALALGFARSVDFFMKGVAGVAAGLGSLFDTMPDYLAEAFELYASPGFWTNIAQLALGAFQSIGGELLNLFMRPLTYLQAGMDTVVQRLAEGIGKIPGIGKALGLEGYTADSYADNLADRELNGFFLKDAAAMSANAGAERISSALAELDALSIGVQRAAKDMALNFWRAAKEGAAAPGPMADLARQLEGSLGEAFEAGAKAAMQRRLEAAVAEAFQEIYGSQISGAQNNNGAGKARDLTGDRLAKIGLFVGGAGGPALDYARRTAIGVEKLLTRLSQPAQASAPALGYT